MAHSDQATTSRCHMVRYDGHLYTAMHRTRNKKALTFEMPSDQIAMCNMGYVYGYWVVMAICIVCDQCAQYAHRYIIT